MSVLVVTEQQGHKWHRMSFEALAAGQEAAKAMDCPLVVAVAGSGVADLAEELASTRGSEVVMLDDPALAGYSPDGFAEALRQAVSQLKPRLVLFPHTYQVRDLAPKLAASLGKAFVSDAVGMRLEGGQPVFVRQLFQGKLHGDVAVEGGSPYFASVQSGAYRADAVAEGNAPALIRSLDLSLDPSAVRTEPEPPYQDAKDAVDLGSADIIVSVGRGIQDPDNIPQAEALAKALGGELAASRPICDNGWLPLDRQIGSSGQTVTPNLYLALGISGAIQHVVGMKGAKTIVAVPSPYTIGRRMWSPEHSTGASATAEEFMDACIPRVRDELRRLADLGVDAIQLDDPWLALNVDPDYRKREGVTDVEREVELSVKCVNGATEGIDDVFLSVHLCHAHYNREHSTKGPYDLVIEGLGMMNVDRFALELATPDAGGLDALRKFSDEKVLGLGVVDHTDPHVETPQEVVERVERAMELVPKERITLNPDCGFAPSSVNPMDMDEAYLKLKAMCDGAKLLREKYG